MSERPILFSTPMVQAIPEGRKTQTRRVVKNMSAGLIEFLAKASPAERGLHCPYGQIGDVLWVRETFWAGYPLDANDCVDYDAPLQYWYFADTRDARPGDMSDNQCAFLLGNDKSDWPRWKPSIFMPKQACRIKLKITDIRVECLQDISEDDAIAEGVERNCLSYAKRDCGRADCVVLGCQDKDFYHYTHDLDDFPAFSAVESFESRWQSINGPESWNLNPFVWVITFEKL